MNYFDRNLPSKDKLENCLSVFSKELEKINDEVVIINTKNLNEIVEQVNSGNFDAVHLHYDQYANIIPSLQCKKKMITSHYPYLENPEPQYVFLYDLLKNSGAHIVCLSDRIQNEFLNRGNDSTNVSILPCGIDVNSYIIDESDVLYPDRSIAISKLCFSNNFTISSSG